MCILKQEEIFFFRFVHHIYLKISAPERQVRFLRLWRCFKLFSLCYYYRFYIIGKGSNPNIFFDHFVFTRNSLQIIACKNTHNTFAYITRHVTSWVVRSLHRLLIVYDGAWWTSNVKASSSLLQVSIKHSVASLPPSSFLRTGEIDWRLFTQTNKGLSYGYTLPEFGSFSDIFPPLMVPWFNR